MEKLAVRFFGWRSGLDTFNYTSLAHHISFYFVSALPHLVLVIGWWYVYKMSQREYMREIEEHMRQAGRLE
jgi:hypothetical protein